MKNFNSKHMAIASCLALLGACFVAPEASAQNKRYKLQVMPPQTKLKPAVQNNVRVVPPATRLATPAIPQSNWGGLYRPNGANVIGQNGASIVANNGSRLIQDGGAYMRPR